MKSYYDMINELKLEEIRLETATYQRAQSNIIIYT